MSNSKKNIVFDLKKNFQEKNSLINRLKDLINSELSNVDKLKDFKSIREKWIKIGKVQSHLSFGLNNSYKHHISFFMITYILTRASKKKTRSIIKK